MVYPDVWGFSTHGIEVFFWTQESPDSNRKYIFTRSTFHLCWFYQKVSGEYDVKWSGKKACGTWKCFVFIPKSSCFWAGSASGWQCLLWLRNVVHATCCGNFRRGASFFLGARRCQMSRGWVVRKGFLFKIPHDASIYGIFTYMNGSCR